MNEEEKELEKKLSISELEDEELDHRVSKEQKKAVIRELKRDYGAGWKKALSWVKSIKVDREAAETLHGNFGRLRDYNDPRMMRR